MRLKQLAEEIMLQEKGENNKRYMLIKERESWSSISSYSFLVINSHPNFEECIMAEDQPQRVSLEDYSSSSTPQYLTSIARLEVQAANITYPHSFIQLIQDNLFHGLPNEDPYAHLATYIEIYNTVKIEEFQKMSSTSIYFLFLWQVKQKNGCTHSKGIACGHGMRWSRSSWRNIHHSPRLLRGRLKSHHPINSLMNHWVKLLTFFIVYSERLILMGLVSMFS